MRLPISRLRLEVESKQMVAGAMWRRSLRALISKENATLLLLWRRLVLLIVFPVFNFHFCGSQFSCCVEQPILPTIWTCSIVFASKIEPACIEFFRIVSFNAPAHCFNNIQAWEKNCKMFFQNLFLFYSSILLTITIKVDIFLIMKANSDSITSRDIPFGTRVFLKDGSDATMRDSARLSKTRTVTIYSGFCQEDCRISCADIAFAEMKNVGIIRVIG